MRPSVSDPSLRRYEQSKGLTAPLTAYRKYSLDYVPDEDRARVGVWAGEFQNPVEVRHPRR